MDFDKSRVYTSINADELKVGSKIICANTKLELLYKVKSNDITELRDVLPAGYTNRFQAYFNEDLINYNLCYLISEPEEKKLKWTDLKIGDIVRYKAGKVEHIVTGIHYDDKAVFFGGEWVRDEELESWEKVE